MNTLNLIKKDLQFYKNDVNANPFASFNKVDYNYSPLLLPNNSSMIPIINLTVPEIIYNKEENLIIPYTQEQRSVGMGIELNIDPSRLILRNQPGIKSYNKEELFEFLKLLGETKYTGLDKTRLVNLIRKKLNLPLI
jgi:hypothetical protein